MDQIGTLGEFSVGRFSDGCLCLAEGNTIHSILAPEGLLLFSYLDWMHSVLVNSSVRSVLHIGGGLLTLPRTLAQGSDGAIRQIVSEISQDVITLQQEHAPTSGVQQSLGEGLDVLSRTQWELDAIAVDAAVAGSLPKSLMSRPFLRLCRERLSVSGVLVYNLPTTGDMNDKVSFVNDLKAIFPHVRFVASPATLATGYGNIVVYASGHIRQLQLRRPPAVIVTEHLPSRSSYGASLNLRPARNEPVSIQDQIATTTALLTKLRELGADTGNLVAAQHGFQHLAQARLAFNSF